MPPALAFDHVSMAFPGVKALDEVSFDVCAGSIHALMGENGAGKSTLLKILSGAYPPSGGSLAIDSQPRAFRDTAEALTAGIAVIHQELHLVPEMSVAENLFLGHLPQTFGIVNRRALAEAARQQLELIGEDINPQTKVGQLSIGQRQMVEIAKALTRGARIIAFDEPTSSLSDREVRRLFTIIRELRTRGCAVLYVSHRMEEIFELCDRITILRDGRHVATGRLPSRDTGVAPLDSSLSLTRDAVVQRMVGRTLADIYNYTPRASRGGEGTALAAGPSRTADDNRDRVPTSGSSTHEPPPARDDRGLVVDGLCGPGLAEPCSFTAAAGEIFGFFGLIGAGRSELLKLLFGAVPKTSGGITFSGRELTITSPRHAIAAGIVLCPEDRKKEGIVPVRSVLENINLSARRRTARVGIFIDESWEQTNARERSAQLHVKTPSVQQLIRNLSGGNQQKVILGRWLSEQVNVLLLDEPTRGIDVGAKSEIYTIMQDLARSGVCVIVVSSELPEILGVSDRIAVMRQGKIAAILDRAEATEEKLLKLALPLETGRAS
ncbi:MAG: L-arabinose ABC transporter ATP-binding protein AraG [Opitutia bacterium]|nr:ATP-binding cassette domain-containing protein [Opitutaceae bacterium]PHX70632.1 MAG: L-arabinose ABC transporter ATP-binding protein AraG [Opitutae bacterium]